MKIKTIVFEKIAAIAGKVKCKIGSHDFEWNYIANGICKQIEKCKRNGCGCQRKNERVEHTIGQWHYVSGNSCNQERACSRCNITQKQQAEHTWGEWNYVSENSCVQEIVCSRCNAHQPHKQRVEHKEGAMQYEAGSCQTVSFCQRCNERKTGSKDHIWGPWQYESETSCHQIACCSRCNARKDHQDKFSHRWSDTIVDSKTGQRERMCTHCGTREW